MGGGCAKGQPPQHLPQPAQHSAATALTSDQCVACRWVHSCLLLLLCALRLLTLCPPLSKPLQNPAPSLLAARQRGNPSSMYIRMVEHCGRAQASSICVKVRREQGWPARLQQSHPGITWLLQAASGGKQGATNGSQRPSVGRVAVEPAQLIRTSCCWGCRHDQLHAAACGCQACLVPCTRVVQAAAQRARRLCNRLGAAVQHRQ